MGKVPNRKGRDGLLFRNQGARAELAIAAEMQELLDRCQVAEVVAARTGGRCYIPGCDQPIVSYPHGVHVADGGTHSPINRAGLCGAHEQALHAGGERGEDLRQFLRDWLRRWHREQDGIPAEVWEARAYGQPDSGEAEVD